MAGLLPQILNVKNIDKARTASLVIDDALYDYGGVVKSSQK
jgi:hypothetical protein